MLRFLDAHWRFMEKVNGHAPFFGRKSLDNSDSFFPLWTDMLRFLCDLAIKNTILATGERTCSVFSNDFQRFRRYWTDMLRFLCRFWAVFRFKSGWIKPLRVGGHAPFSPCKLVFSHNNSSFNIVAILQGKGTTIIKLLKYVVYRMLTIQIHRIFYKL